MNAHDALARALEAGEQQLAAIRDVDLDAFLAGLPAFEHACTLVTNTDDLTLDEIAPLVALNARICARLQLTLDEAGRRLRTARLGQRALAAYTR